jgi:antitoxin component YwqK of YwqJK toxin-antitoxin module
VVERTETEFGTRIIESFYTNSNGVRILHGACAMYYKDGTKQGEWSYREGRLHGKMTVFTVNGTKAAEGWYRNGEPWEGVLQVKEHFIEFHKGVRVRAVE